MAELNNDKHVLLLQVLDDKVVLVIPKCERGDTGTYTVRLQNPSGTVEGTINATVLGASEILYYSLTKGIKDSCISFIFHKVLIR